MLAFSIDYYGVLFRATQSVGLFCTYDDFADLYEGRAEAFIEFISDLAVAVPGTYKDTWNYIEKNYNSLNRHSNMHLLFEQNGASSQLTAAAP